jgi:hypothetical protein
VQKGSSKIIVFYIQGFTATGRHLVNEAEYTPVAAPSDGERSKLKPQIVVRLLADLQFYHAAAFFLYRDGKPLIGSEETEIDNVVYILSVYGNDRVSRF